MKETTNKPWLKDKLTWGELEQQIAFQEEVKKIQKRKKNKRYV